MPKKPTDYSKGLIYKFVCLDTDITDIYVGSTTSFKHRKAGHKSICYNEKNKDYNSYVYKFIRENGGWEAWNMILVEYYPCKSSLDLHKREREIIEELKSTLNKNIPSRTNKEYYEKIKEYYYDNKDKILEEKKIYYEENKEQILERNKKYNENNKEQIAEKQKEKTTCECGSIFRKYDKARHLKSKKHQNYINGLHTKHP